MRNVDAAHSEVLSKIGIRLRKLREKKGYTNHEEFAYEINMARSQYGRYEAGTNMNILTLLQILDAHELTLEEFFSIEI